MEEPPTPIFCIVTSRFTKNLSNEVSWMRSALEETIFLTDFHSGEHIQRKFNSTPNSQPLPATDIASHSLPTGKGFSKHGQMIASLLLLTALV
jgi:hypothetical protein